MSPAGGVEHRLPYYEGKCPRTTGAMTNLQEWINKVEDLTHKVWNEDEEILLALQCLKEWSH